MVLVQVFWGSLFLPAIKAHARSFPPLYDLYLARADDCD